MMIFDRLIILGLFGPLYIVDYLSILCIFDNCCNHYSNSYCFKIFRKFTPITSLAQMRKN